jgi:DNA-binding CsgD family transcriptional regulator
MARDFAAMELVLIAIALSGLAPAHGMEPTPAHEATAQLVPDAKSDYLRKLAAYQAARQAFEDLSAPYWDEVRQKRQLRSTKRRNGETIVAQDYALTQPPLYSGPPRPVPPPDVREELPRPPALPVVADFLRHAHEQYRFAPTRPASEIDFKQAYAKIARAAGLTREQAVRIYAFEAGGNGKYDTQAGLEEDRPGAHAISTALGYNQLLNTNSVEIIAEQGERFGAALKEKLAVLAATAGTAFIRKIEVVREMTVFCRSVPDRWNEHERLGNTAKGLAVHALNLDIDVGPLLQTQKLLDSVVFARRKGYGRHLTAAELEMMNLTGDGNGYDMVTIPEEMRAQIPTSNFFLRNGYERNPVAIRNNTVAKLLAATNSIMDKGTMLQGARDLAAAF